MKRLVITLAIMISLGLCAAIPSFFTVRGQNPNKFRRARADKRINGQYIFALNDGNGTNDCNGHGTHVSGTVGGATYGVAKNVTLVAVRVLDCNGSGSTSGVISGVDWVTSNHLAGQPAVANMSLGGGASSAL